MTPTTAEYLARTALSSAEVRVGELRRARAGQVSVPPGAPRCCGVRIGASGPSGCTPGSVRGWLPRAGPAREGLSRL